MWQVAKPLRPHPLAVGQARNFCTRRLESVLDGRPDPDGAIADAAAIASELVTNAITAGSSEIELFLALNESSVRIEITDDAAGSVVARDAAPEDPNGRGLMVVAALSRAWGVHFDNGSKQVWAEVEIPPRVPSG